MTLQELFDKLNGALKQLVDKDVNDSGRVDLEIIVLHLKREIQRGVFDPLKELDQVSVTDTRSLSKLADQVGVVVQQEQERAKIMTQLIATAKIALRASGIPLPG